MAASDRTRSTPALDPAISKSDQPLAETAAVVEPTTIRIDPEFAALIPPLSASERAMLEASLRQDGLREPLVVWQETGLLLDGHNRLPLCRTHRIPLRVVYRSFPDRAAAVAGLLRIQLSRRNLSAEAASYLRGKRYLEEKKAHGGARTDRAASGHPDHLKTAVRLAREFHVGEKTIRRDAQLALALDDIASVGGEKARPLLLARDSGLRRSQILRLARRKPAEQRQFLEYLERTGKPPRQRRGGSPRRTVTLPTDPQAFVDALLQRLEPREAARIAQILSRQLHRPKEPPRSS